MIIRTAVLTNFGLYDGECSFDLRPETSDGRARPITLILGKNGVGKTTLAEGIRLCLHGPLAVGHRVSKQEYNDYLLSRMHQDPNLDDQTAITAVEVSFDYVSSGQKLDYAVKRSWSRKGATAEESVTIWENGQLLVDVDPGQIENFLRELVPPTSTDLFFFDGEKIEVLAEEATGSFLLAETLRTLLGLNMVSQLQKDLDIYISRQSTGEDESVLLAQVETISERTSSLNNQRVEVLETLEALTRELHDSQKNVLIQEQKIASEGGWFAEQRDRLRGQQAELEVAIDEKQRNIQDLCAGLMPFAIAYDMSRSVANRLQAEQLLEQENAALAILRKEIEKLLDTLTADRLWEDIDTTVKNELLPRIQRLIGGFVPSSDVPKSIPILEVSERERRTLLTWIDSITEEVPQQFCAEVSQLEELQSELMQIEHDLSLVPPDETLRPLVEKLHEYQAQTSRLRDQTASLSNELKGLDYQIESLESNLKNLLQTIQDQQKNNRRIELAVKSRQALSAYAEVLIERKLHKLETILVDRFNDLYRKRHFIDRVAIDPTNFSILLFQGERSISQKQLSAGEKQILATATLWALRQLSELPMPVIIDTPLGRLDSEHRLKLVQSYFPYASHQVVLLATDMEIDDDMIVLMEPAIARIYELEFDSDRKSTLIHLAKLDVET